MDKAVNGGRGQLPGFVVQSFTLDVPLCGFSSLDTTNGLGSFDHT